MAKSNKVLTIDITNESITIVEVTPSVKKGTHVHNALIFETPADLKLVMIELINFIKRLYQIRIRCCTESLQIIFV